MRSFALPQTAHSSMEPERVNFPHFPSISWTKKEPHTKTDKLRGGLHGKLYKLRDLK